jgi:hypothetical protein
MKSETQRQTGLSHVEICLKAFEAIRDIANQAIKQLAVSPKTSPILRSVEKPKFVPEKKPVFEKPKLDRSSAPLPKGEFKVLTAVAQHGSTGVTREQLTVLAGYARSTRDAYVQRLVSSGFLDIRGSFIVVTEAGIRALGPSFKPLPTGDALREHWLNALPVGESVVLEMFIDVWPSKISREEISDRTKYARSTRDAYIQRLLTRRLLQDDNGLSASAHLFSQGL